MFRQHPPQGAGDQQPPSHLNCRQAGGAASQQGTSDRLQAGITPFFSTPQVSEVTSHGLQALRTQQQIPKAEVPRDHQAPLRKQGRESVPPGTLGGGNDSLFITHQDTRSAITCHLAKVTQPTAPKVQLQRFLDKRLSKFRLRLALRQILHRKHRAPVYLQASRLLKERSFLKRCLHLLFVIQTFIFFVLVFCFAALLQYAGS